MRWGTPGHSAGVLPLQFGLREYEKGWCPVFPGENQGEREPHPPLHSCPY